MITFWGRGFGWGAGLTASVPVNSRGPAGLAHVHPTLARVARSPQRRPLPLVTGERLAFVAGQEGPVGVDDPPPGDAAAPQGHDPPHLTRAALAEVLGDVAVGHHPARRDGLYDTEHAVGEVRHLGSAGPASGGHGPGGGQGSPDEPGSSGGGGWAGGFACGDGSGRSAGSRKGGAGSAPRGAGSWPDGSRHGSCRSGQGSPPGIPPLSGQSPVPGHSAVPGHCPSLSLCAASGGCPPSGHCPLIGRCPSLSLYPAPGGCLLSGHCPPSGHCSLPRVCLLPGRCPLSCHCPLAGVCAVSGHRPLPGLCPLSGICPLPGHPPVPGHSSVPGHCPPSCRCLPSDFCALSGTCPPPGRWPLSGQCRLSAHRPSSGHWPLTGHGPPLGAAAGDLRARRAATAAMARQASTSSAYRTSRPLPRGATGTGDVAPDPPPKCVAAFTRWPAPTSWLRRAAAVSAAAASTVPKPTRSSYPRGGGFWALEVIAWSTRAGDRWG